MGTEPTARFDIHDAEINLSRIIERVEHGEESIISRAGTPVAKVIPLPGKTLRSSYGTLKGKITVADDWDSPEVNDAIADDFHGQA